MMAAITMLIRSGISFEIASSQALRKGVADANPVLLEPIVKLTVTVPDGYTGEVMSDLNTKRSRILGMIPREDVTDIEAEVPLAEVQRYAQDPALRHPGPGQLQIGIRPLRARSSQPGAQGHRRSQAGPRRGTGLVRESRSLAAAGNSSSGENA